MKGTFVEMDNEVKKVGLAVNEERSFLHRIYDKTWLRRFREIFVREIGYREIEVSQDEISFFS